MDWTAKDGITEIRAPLEKDVEPTMVVGSDTTTRPSTLKTDWQTDRILEAGEKKLCTVIQQCLWFHSNITIALELGNLTFDWDFRLHMLLRNSNANILSF
jgi:hypothetical protein